MTLLFKRLQGGFREKREGMVLVMSLWILSLLAVFALSVALGIRQKIVLVSRLEKRSEVHQVAKAGAQTARVVLMNALEGAEKYGPVYVKTLLHNNPEAFSDISFANGAFEVSYFNYDIFLERGERIKMYGLEDEQSKLNINTATATELRQLFSAVAGIGPEEVKDLANAIVDWRSKDDSAVPDFYGDEYYESLNFPYHAKKGSFELLEEVLLVKGMNPAIFERVKDFITVYGNGKVNLNTASPVVLRALGLSAHVTDIVLDGRNGKDHRPATEDDYIFKDDNVSLYLNDFVPLTDKERGEIDFLYSRKKLCTKSSIYHAKVKAMLEDGKETRFIDCVFEGKDAKILVWREY